MSNIIKEYYKLENDNYNMLTHKYNNLLSEKKYTINDNIPQLDDNINNLMIDSFKSSIQVHKNGKLVNNDYYNNVPVSNNHTIQPSIEYVEQVNPNDFFGNSMKGIL